MQHSTGHEGATTMDNKPRDYEGEVTARIAWDALFKPPTKRAAKEQAALNTALGKPRTPETVGAR